MTSTSTSAGAPVRAPLRRVPTAVSAAVLVMAVLVGCSPASAGRDDGSASAGGSGPVAAGELDPATLVPSVAPGPTRAPAQRLDPAPAAGTVRVEAGPFTDRLTFSGLAVQGAQVVGRVENAVDVSELIVLALQADFYDASGRLLGSGTATYADEEFADTGATPLPHGTGVHDEAFRVVVPSRPRLPGAVSAVLTVPQLVNE